MLTVITQVGGLIWLITLLVAHFLKLKKRFLFPVIYITSNLIIVPLIASNFGRTQLPIFHDEVKPRNLIYPLLFRNYVKPELEELLLSSGDELKEHNIEVVYLDACFPFKDGFPLFPHLSHNDGKKVDISFIYKTKEGIRTQKKPSTTGYGVFVDPKSFRGSQTERCIKKGHWQYDKAHYLSLGTFNKLDFDKEGTKLLLTCLLRQSSTQKILLEPHLKRSLGLNHYDKIRFHGCKAVRHDDHLHLQIK